MDEIVKIIKDAQKKRHDNLSKASKNRFTKEVDLIKERFDYWESTRGCYILDQKYRDELREFIFTGKAKGLCDFEEYKKSLKEEQNV